MRKESHLNRRNKLIYNRYAELWGQGLREERIWPQLEEDFFLEKATLYRIVLKMSRISEDSQPKIEFIEKEEANGVN